MKDSGTKGACFVLGMVVTCLFLLLTDKSVYERLMHSFDWTAIAAIGTFCAVFSALYIAQKQNRDNERLRDEKNLLAFQMIKEPAFKLNETFKNFITIINFYLGEIEQIRIDNKYNKIHYTELDKFKSGINFLINQAVITKQIIDKEIDFKLIQSNLDFLISSKNDIRETTELIFKILSSKNRIDFTFQQLDIKGDNTTGTKELILIVLRSEIDQCVSYLDRMIELINNRNNLS